LSAVPKHLMPNAVETLQAMLEMFLIYTFLAPSRSFIHPLIKINVSKLSSLSH
jgi:hypothetical protein